MKNQINTDTKFILQEFYFPYDEINDESDFDNPVYLKPIIYFNDLTEYHNIVKKDFSKSENYLQLTEYYHDTESIDQNEYYNAVNHCMDDSTDGLSNVDLEKLNNTLDSILGDGYKNSL